MAWMNKMRIFPENEILLKYAFIFVKLGFSRYKIIVSMNKNKLNEKV